MFKLPPHLTGLSALQQQVLEDALRYQDMVEQAEKALGLGGLEALRAFRQEHELIEQMRRPEMKLMEDYQNLMSGVTAQRETMEAAMGGSAMTALGRNLNEVLELAEGFSGPHSLHRAAERLAMESTGVEGLRRSADTLSPAFKDLGRAAGMYATFESLAKEQAALEARSLGGRRF